MLLNCSLRSHQSLLRHHSLPFFFVPVPTLRGRDVDLSQREFQLAKLLFSEINRPIPRQKLLLAIWGSTDIENSRSLDVHVSKIIRTLGLSDDRSTARLVSIYGFGYRLMEIFPQ